MHVCMIDENSHYSHTGEPGENNMFSHRKRAPIEVFLTSTGIASSFSSQEPRRPRFSFFHLHNFKELTSLPSRARTSSEALLPNSFREQDLSSGCPADRLPFQKSLISGSG